MVPFNPHKSITRLLVLALAALTTSCAYDPEGVRGDDFGLDEFYGCPEGFVGFNFSKTRVDTRSEYYQDRLGDDAFAPLPSQGTIALQEVTCTAGKSQAKAEWNRLYGACNGKAECLPAKPASACGERVVTYSCGVASASDAGVQEERTARATERLDCTGAGKKLEIAAEERTLCVPRVCPINSHRDERLNCVPDATMPGLESASIAKESFTALYNIRPKHAIDDGKPLRLHRDTPYEVELSLYTKGLEGMESPSRASVTYWLGDVYIPIAKPDTAWNAPEAILLFRCNAFNVDLERDEMGALSTKEAHVIPETCYYADSRIQQDLKRRTGLDVPLKRYKRLQTRVFHSFDITGRIALERASVGKAGRTFKDTVASPCAPNPLEFFYDSASKSFDMVRYLQQRSIDEFSGFWSDKHASRPVSLWTEAADVAHLVVHDLRLGKAEVVVGQGPIATDPLPVDVTWSTPNWHGSNPLVPNNYCARNDKFKTNGWSQVKSTATGGKVDLEVCNFAPPNLRADIYLGVAKGTPPLLGSVPLAGGTSEVVTVNHDLRISRDTRAKFFDPSSPLYISPTQKSRAFYVFTCLGVDRPEVTFDVRPWMTRQDCNAGNDEDPECEIDWSMSAKDGNRNFVLEVTQAKSFPPGVKGTGPGCVMSETPIVITADRLIRPIDPVLGVAFGGDTDDTSSGDGTMSATQTNSSEVTCSDKGQESCVEVVGGGMKSKGELGRSYFSVEGSLDRKQGSSVQSDFTGEMLGIQVFDMADPDSDMAEVSWPGKPSSKKVELTVVPPWDALYAKLKRATGGTPVEWSKGRYAGVTGLGVGIGYKTPFQVGPIPGLITISASIGVAVEATAELQFAPAEGEQYPCIGTKRCYEVSTTNATQSEASEACTERGGRLAELSSATEATELEAALKGKSGSYWIGGQMAFEYDDPSCVESYKEDLCKGGATSSYRWLSNDVELAKAKGGNAAKFVEKTFFGSKQPTLYTILPKQGGFAYKAGGTTTLIEQSTLSPYVCVFEPASSVNYLGWSLALKLGVGAGVGLSFCSPSDDFGFCLGGSLNVLSTGLTPTWSNEYYWLKRDGAVKRRTGTTAFSIPWNVTLLEGALYAQANAYLVSATWNIVEFEGFKLAEGELLRFEYPFQVDYK